MFGLRDRTHIVTLAFGNSHILHKTGELLQIRTKGQKNSRTYTLCAKTIFVKAGMDKGSIWSETERSAERLAHNWRGSLDRHYFTPEASFCL